MTNDVPYAVTQDTGNRAFKVNVYEVMQFYKRRHKRKPNVVYCHPDCWDGKTEEIEGAQIKRRNKILKNYYYAAVEENILLTFSSTERSEK